MKTTATAPINIALIKYWGKKDEKLRLPTNGSISVNLSNLHTTTTVEFSEKCQTDDVLINNERREKEVDRVVKHLDRIRKLAKIDFKAKVVSQNNFPTAGGLASSASGFAALTAAASKAAGLSLSEKELTILARLGSGSACRSIPDGFVEWKDGEKNEDSFAVSIFPRDHWNISIITVIVDSDQKKIGSTDGHKLATTSPFFKTRLNLIDKKISLIKHLIKEKSFKRFGELVEGEALEMHAIMLTSTPSLIYWNPGTIEIMKFVQKLRAEGLPVYFTIDAGPHPFLVCQEKDVRQLANELKSNQSVKKIIVNQPAKGTGLTSTYLF